METNLIPLIATLTATITAIAALLAALAQLIRANTEAAARTTRSPTTVTSSKRLVNLLGALLLMRWLLGIWGLYGLWWMHAHLGDDGLTLHRAVEIAVLAVVAVQGGILPVPSPR